MTRGPSRRARWTRVACEKAGRIAILASLGSTPQATRIPIASECRECRTTAKPHAAFRDVTGVLRGKPATVVQTGTGDWSVVGERGWRSPPFRFDSTGAMRGALGGRGLGPAETTDAYAIEALADGRIRVHSPGRINEFAASGAFLRATVGSGRSAPGAGMSVFLPSGTSITLSRYHWVDGRPAPIFVRKTGDAAHTQLDIPGAKGANRTIGPARRARKEGFAFAEYSQNPPTNTATLGIAQTDGKVLRTFTFAPGWWTRPLARPIRSVRVVGSAIRDIRETERGHLLLLVDRPRRDLSESAIAAMVAANDGPLVYEAVLVTIDPIAANVIALDVVAGSAVSILTDERFATYAEDASGVPALQVWELPRTQRRTGGQ